MSSLELFLHYNHHLLAQGVSKLPHNSLLPSNNLPFLHNHSSESLPFHDNMTLSECELSQQLATIVDLPYDLVRELCVLLPGKDIASLLSTSRSLHSLSRDEAIWHELCRRYGDNKPADFGDTSYHRIYTLLLHPYGSLLGLWASDHPFKGGVIEFRIDPEYKGIVGEVWRFWPRHLLDNDDEEQPPKLPEFFAFTSITLPKMEDRSQRAVLSWHVTGTEQGEYFGPDTASIHVPTLHVLSETCQSAFLAYSTGSTNPENVRSSPHPDFPSPGADAWYDYTRKLPHLKRVPSPISLGGKDFIKAAPRAFIYSDSTNVVKPAALTIRPSYRSGGHPLACHEAPVPLPDVRNQHSSDPLGWFHRRYYPLRSLIQDGQEPSDDDWHPRSLEGLWLGSYGPHGTEILFLEYDEVMREIRAWKITGDMNVPRGAQTWNIRLSDAVSADSLAPTHPFKDIQSSRLFQGTGTICSRGFIDDQRSSTDNLVAITSNDEIRVNWNDAFMNYSPRYKRYMGRDLTTETRERFLRRPLGWI